MEVDGGNYEKWDIVWENKRKNVQRNTTDESDCSQRTTLQNVIVKLAKEGDSFSNYSAKR